MSLTDLFSKEGRAKSAVEKNAKRVLAKHLQSPDRYAAMEKLREIGTDEAIFALSRRYSYVYDKTIEDEQEKSWVHDSLVAMGDKAVPSLIRYLRSADTLSQPLQTLEKLATPKVLFEVIDELLGREEPGYTRNPTRKLQLLGWLSDWQEAPAAEISRRIVPYLTDFDEGVRFTAVESLAHHKDEATARAGLLAALLRPEEESRRILVRIAEVLAAAGWTVTDRKEEVARLITAQLPEFGMQHDKLVRKEK